VEGIELVLLSLRMGGVAVMVGKKGRGGKKLHVREGHVLGEAVTGLERHGCELSMRNVGR